MTQKSFIEYRFPVDMDKRDYEDFVSGVRDLGAKVLEALDDSGDSMYVTVAHPIGEKYMRLEALIRGLDLMDVHQL